MYLFLSLLAPKALLTIAMETGKAPRVAKGTRAKICLVFFLTKYERAFLQCTWVCACVYSLWSHLIGKAPIWPSARLIGSLGHVLGHGLPHFILQVRQLLPIGLQLQPVIIWHLHCDEASQLEMSLHHVKPSQKVFTL